MRHTETERIIVIRPKEKRRSQDTFGEAVGTVIVGIVLVLLVLTTCSFCLSRPDLGSLGVAVIVGLCWLASKIDPKA